MKYGTFGKFVIALVMGMLVGAACADVTYPAGVVDKTGTWTTWGNSVTVVGDELRVRQDTTDNGGNFLSPWMDFNPAKKIVIERDVAVNYANNYFCGGFIVRFATVDEGLRDFGVMYANYAYNSGDGGYVPKNGFYLVKNELGAFCWNHPANFSSPTTAIWNSWFKEKLEYTPSTGQLKMYQNGSLVSTFTSHVFSSKETPKFRIFATAWGWGTGHYQYMKNLTIWQE